MLKPLETWTERIFFILGILAFLTLLVMSTGCSTTDRADRPYGPVNPPTDPVEVSTNEPPFVLPDADFAEIFANALNEQIDDRYRDDWAQHAYASRGLYWLAFGETDSRLEFFQALENLIEVYRVGYLKEMKDRKVEVDPDHEIHRTWDIMYSAVTNLDFWARAVGFNRENRMDMLANGVGGAASFIIHCDSELMVEAGEVQRAQWPVPTLAREDRSFWDWLRKFFGKTS